MAPAEVLAAFPGEARRPATTDWYDDGPILVEIPNLEIGAASYKVNFVFTEEKLTCIRVSIWSIPEAEAVGRYGALLKLQTDRYGPPAACATDDRSSELIQNVRVQCQWIAPSARVTLTRDFTAVKKHLALGLAKRPSGVTVTYAPPVQVK